MQGTERLATLTGVRRGEAPSVLLTFLFIATVVASFVLAKTIRNGLFLAQFDAHRLVYVYVAVPLILTVFVPFYTRVVARSGQRTVLLSSLVVFLVNILLFWLLFRLDPRPMWSAVFYVWVNCYGVIAPFQAWSFANSVFDTRQAKRLFGLIGSGASAGAVTGGLLARVLVGPVGGAANLLLVLAALLVVAGLLVVRTLKVIPRRKPVPFETTAGAHPGQTLLLVARTKYLRWLAASVFFVAVVTQWTQFQFLLVAQERYTRDADRLTAFLGEFNVYFGIVAFLVQFLFTGPLLRRFGVALTVLLLPLSLGLGSTLILLFPALWSVLFTTALDQSLRFSVDKATYELLYLPLPPAMRPAVKGTIDMVFNRGADAVGGLLLGLATQGFHLGIVGLPGAGFGLRGIAATNLVLIAAWVAAALRVRRGYVDALRDSVRRHRLDPEQTTASYLDRSTAEVLAERLDTGDERELLYTLSLLEKRRRTAPHPALRPLLDHTSAAVRRRALALLDASGDRSAVVRAQELLHDDDLETRTVALSYLTHHAGVDPLAAIREIKDFASHSVRAGMVAFLARPGPSQNIDAARLILDAMLEEPEPGGRPARLEAARLAETLPEGFGRAIGRLLRDSEVEVARLAIRAVGKRRRKEFLPELMACLASPDLSPEAARSLAALGDDVVETLRAQLVSPGLSLEVRREIPSVLVRIATPAAQRALLESLMHGDPALRLRVIDSLNRARKRRGEPVPTEAVETVLAAEIIGHYRSYQILARLGRELSEEDAALRGLRQTLEEEVERIFGLLSLMMPGHDLQSAHLALRSDDGQARANALELLDNVLPPSLRRLVVPLLDGHVSVEERAALAGRLAGAPVETREEAVAILAASPDPWLRACAARLIGSLGLRSLEERLEPWTHDQDPLLRETARAALLQLHPPDEGPSPGISSETSGIWESSDRLGLG